VESHIIAIIKKAASGDMQAQTAVYEFFNLRFLKYAAGLLLRKGCPLPEQHSHGVVSAAWGNIFKGLPGLWSPYNFYGWALRIIGNSAYGHLSQCIKQQNEISFNSRAKRPPGESGEREIPFDPASLGSRDDVFFSGILIDQIKTIAAGISPKFLTILELRLEEGWDERAIAERIGETYGNTRTIYSRGMRALMRALGVEKKKELKKRFPPKKTDDDIH
jgi:DNA-directed RNA polymerase specialized sigma24 family protein